MSRCTCAFPCGGTESRCADAKAKPYTLHKGMIVYLKDGDYGVVNDALSGGYELKMASTNKYHTVRTDGACGMFGDPKTQCVDWKKTRETTQFYPAPDAPKDPLTTMIDGTHYTGLGIQPVEFAMTQGYDFCAASILKYVTRHKAKNGRQDVQKAIHFAELRATVIKKHDLSRFLGAVFAVWKATGLTWFIKLDDRDMTTPDIDVYCKDNGIEGDERLALRYLAAWIETGNEGYLPRLQHALNDILASYDSTDN